MPRGRPKKRAAAQGRAVTEAQKVQALKSHLKRPNGDKEAIEDFRKKVGFAKDGLKALLQQRTQQAEKVDASRSHAMSALIAEVLTKSNKASKRKTTTFPGTKIADNAIYTLARKVNTARKSMLSEHYRLDASIERMGGDNKSMIREKRKQLIEKAEKLIRLGHKIAVRNVKKAVDTGMDDDEKEECEGGIGAQKAPNLELRDGLRYAERGIRRMVKGLPKDRHPDKRFAGA